MLNNYQVHCARGGHPYEPIVFAESEKSAIKEVKAEFRRRHGKGAYGKQGCRQSGKNCALVAIRYEYDN